MRIKFLNKHKEVTASSLDNHDTTHNNGPLAPSVDLTHK